MRKKPSVTETGLFVLLQILVKKNPSAVFASAFIISIWPFIPFHKQPFFIKRSAPSSSPKIIILPFISLDLFYGKPMY